MSDAFYKWCESEKDCGHTVQGASPTARQRKLGWDAAIALGAGWLEYPANKPDDDEPVLVAALTTEKTSVVQFAKFHICSTCKGEWELFEPLGAAVITHFLKIPKLPPIHHVKNQQLN